MQLKIPGSRLSACDTEKRRRSVFSVLPSPPDTRAQVSACARSRARGFGTCLLSRLADKRAPMPADTGQLLWSGQ